MQDDLLERSFEAAAAKYKRMHGLEHKLTETEDSQALESGPKSESQTCEKDKTAVLQRPGAASSQTHIGARVLYSKDDLTDIAELSKASAADQDILPKLRELHLERCSQATDMQQNGHRQQQPLPSQKPSSTTLHADSKHQSLPQGSQKPAASTSEHTQSEQQQDSAQQQYSEADVAAYWQYYGYTAPPPTPPPAPQLCATHLKLLEQMLSASTDQVTPEPTQQAAPPQPQSPRAALESRAQSVQNGDLTSLLMAWFDAGYQMGKHEASLSIRDNT